MLTKQISFKLDERTYNKLLQQGSIEGKSPSEVARDVVREDVNKDLDRLNYEEEMKHNIIVMQETINNLLEQISELRKISVMDYKQGILDNNITHEYLKENQGSFELKINEIVKTSIEIANKNLIEILS
ncbi:MAG: hypothetical protein H8E34_11105 [Bacteroidetes bacterium]|nr:hypothetical protein [Bacteroidota bacterium]